MTKSLKDYAPIEYDNDNLVVTFSGDVILRFHILIMRSRFIGSLFRYLYEYRGIRSKSITLSECKTGIVLDSTKKISYYCNIGIFHVLVEVKHEVAGLYSEYPSFTPNNGGGGPSPGNGPEDNTGGRSGTPTGNTPNNQLRNQPTNTMRNPPTRERNEQRPRQ